ncbi:hypothetical protein ERY430_41144 [Erythrobacter sp. EC-HK427]|nr:hypothetical protein ERY430_41144 [Erythrobacter sp. EC-HK427]
MLPTRFIAMFDLCGDYVLYKPSQYRIDNMSKKYTMAFARLVRLKVVMDLARLLRVPVQVHQSYFTTTDGKSDRSVI